MFDWYTSKNQEPYIELLQYYKIISLNFEL